MELRLGMEPNEIRAVIIFWKICCRGGEDTNMEQEKEGEMWKKRED
jgi:hypothetical protein